MGSHGPSFVPAPGGKHMRAGAVAAPAAVAMLGATPAFADEIGTAAKKLSDAAYPLLKDVDWNSGLALTKPGSASAADFTKAIHKAIGSASGGVTSQADFEAINAALGRMIASVPESKVMDVYNAFSKVVSPDVPKYLMSTVKEADAKAAYAALMDFKGVMKAHPIAPAASTSSVSGGAINDAAKKLSAAAYP